MKVNNKQKASQLSPLGLYIHIPFCQAKCRYCNFFTLTGKIDRSPAYFRALQSEISGYQGITKGNELTTIYFGGGTPSLVSAQLIGDVIAAVRLNFNLATDCEITLEANPESLTLEKLNTYRQVGITRISLGLQAWQDELLKYMGRLYTIAEFQEKLKLLPLTGFTNYNLDLIFGLPGQTTAQWRESVDNVIKCAPKHISCYSLELDNDSFFGKMYKVGKLTAADDATDREMYWYAVDKLKENGYEHYEISNFARPGYESQHNLAFWQGLPYIGIGAAAHSFIGNRRYNNIYSIEKYTAQTLTSQTVQENLEIIDHKQAVFEYVLLRLRLLDGIKLSDFAGRFQLPLTQAYPEQLRNLLKQKLITLSSDRLRLTRRGIDLINHVMLEFA